MVSFDINSSVVSPETPMRKVFLYDRDNYQHQQIMMSHSVSNS